MTRLDEAEAGAPQVEAHEKARILTEALPYIRFFSGKTVVVKIGGAALDDPAMAARVAQDLTLMDLVGVRLIVIHGGGPQVSQAMTEAGIVPRFIDGLRVTDDASMEVVRRVLIGSINNALVARLCETGLKAVGLSGTDAELIRAETVTGQAGRDLGRVGRVTGVNTALVSSLLEDGYTPVIASVAMDGDGSGALNINADAVAGAVAAGMTAAKLIYLTNVEGLYRDFGDSQSLIPELTLAELTAMSSGISAGMGPKVASIVHALESGVGKAHILDGRVEHALLLEIFTEKGIGTQVIA
ncbi:MAG: acetylglutamate kinase [Actinomycetota bacterium]|nr:acetylglutamate kinase [Actinomycetota bacterium]